MKDFLRTVHSATHKSYERNLEISAETTPMYLSNHTSAKHYEIEALLLNESVYGYADSFIKSRFIDTITDGINLVFNFDSAEDYSSSDLNLKTKLEV
jgi:hypothetical protein